MGAADCDSSFYCFWIFDNGFGAKVEFPVPLAMSSSDTGYVFGILPSIKSLKPRNRMFILSVGFIPGISTTTTTSFFVLYTLLHV